MLHSPPPYHPKSLEAKSAIALFTLGAALTLTGIILITSLDAQLMTGYITLGVGIVFCLAAAVLRLLIESTLNHGNSHDDHVSMEMRPNNSPPSYDEDMQASPPPDYQEREGGEHDGYFPPDPDSTPPHYSESQNDMPAGAEASEQLSEDPNLSSQQGPTTTLTNAQSVAGVQVQRYLNH